MQAQLRLPLWIWLPRTQRLNRFRFGQLRFKEGPLVSIERSNCCLRRSGVTSSQPGGGR